MNTAEILAFERKWWRYRGSKEEAIRETFGVSTPRYYQVLNQILYTEEAMLADPLTVKRLRRIRDSRSAKPVRTYSLNG